MTRQLCHVKQIFTYAKTVLKLHCFIWVMCLGLSISLLSDLSSQEHENLQEVYFMRKYIKSEWANIFLFSHSVLFFADLKT